MKTIKKTGKNITAALAAVVLLVFFFLTNLVLPVRARAAATVTDFTKTEILDDLEDLDPGLYLPNPLGKPEVVRFQEYCYSDKYFFKQYYGLYVYVYNPTCAVLEETNYVNVATSYDANGKPNAYANVALTTCSFTQDHLFYKFKLAQAEEFLTMAKGYASLHEGVRRYDVAGITLTGVEDARKDYEYAWTFYFSGFAAGCGETADSESTLTARMEKLKTLKLDVKHTNYRTEDFNADDICDSLDSVYFSVPEEYFTNYGGLQKIKAEWYEYKTKEIFVTSDVERYNCLDDYIGKDYTDKTLFPNGNQSGHRVYWGKYNEWDDKGDAKTRYAWMWNGEYSYRGNKTKDVTQIDWLFLRANATAREDMYVSKEEVLSYMQWYTEKFSSQEKIRGKYAVGLFTDRIDEDRLGLLDNPSDLCGRVEQEFDADKLEDKQDLFYEVEQSGWDRFWKGAKYETSALDPILVFDKNDKTTLQGMSAETFAETYRVNPDEATSIKNYCLEKLENGERPVLFRFAVTDYYASSACFDYDWALINGQDGYVAQETVFLDFDIISLTFRAENGEETVIACVSDPLDIINGLTPPTDLNMSGWDWLGLWNILYEGLMAFVSIVAVVVLLYLLIRLIIWLIKTFANDGGGDSSA